MALGAGEPQPADYSERGTAAVKSVLIEVGQTLGSFGGKFAFIGGAVPWLLLDDEEMPHVGTLDVDLGLDHEALGDGEYAMLVGALQQQGYEQSEELRYFQLSRQVDPGDGGPPIRVVDAYGPGCARSFAEEAQILDGRTADEWQQNAFGQVQVWLVAMASANSADEP